MFVTLTPFIDSLYVLKTCLTKFYIDTSPTPVEIFCGAIGTTALIARVIVSFRPLPGN